MEIEDFEILLMMSRFIFDLFEQLLKWGIYFV